MSSACLDAVIINPTTDPSACIIWLHGLGADGHDFEPLIPQLNIVERYAVRVVLPHAPQRAVTINGGMQMPAWYDITGTDFESRQDSSGMQQSAQQLQALIEREVANGIPTERIVLAGFSQGGAVVLHTGLRYSGKLAGILALSTYLPLADRVAAEASPSNCDIPIFMAHGMQDPVVPEMLGTQSRDALNGLGYRVDWHSYAMPHAVCPEEIRDIGVWLSDLLQQHTVTLPD